MRHTVPGDSTKTWLHVLVEQLEAPLGPAVTLTNLIATNRELQNECVTPQLVNNFVQMILNLGPQPRLVNFFSAICEVNQAPQKANQEMILRLVWMNEQVDGRSTPPTNPTGIIYRRYPSIQHQPNPPVPMIIPAQYPDPRVVAPHGVRAPRGAITYLWRGRIAIWRDGGRR